MVRASRRTFFSSSSEPTVAGFIARGLIAPDAADFFRDHYRRHDGSERRGHYDARGGHGLRGHGRPGREFRESREDAPYARRLSGDPRSRRYLFVPRLWRSFLATGARRSGFVLR